MDKIYNLTIDTKRKSYNKVLGIKQNENNVVLNITLVQNSIALDLTDCTVRLNYLNNNNILLQMADIVEVKEGKIKVNVLTKVLKDIGETPVDISIFDKDNRKITSATFTIVVQASIYTNDKLDKEELDLIQDIYNKEETRILNEETRQANEKERKSNEYKRIKDENARNQEEIKRQANEKIRIENEKNRVKVETNRSDTFDLLKQQTEENIETQNKNIAIQEKEIQENKEINSNITTAEKERVISENNRQQGYSEMKNTINDFSICEIYNSDKKYKKFNRVVFDGSSYECLKECQHINPSSTEYWICIAQKGQDGKGTGDMQTSIYDKNNNGIVDDSEKLGGKSPDEYIQKQNKTTWAQLNVQDKNSSGITPHLSFNRPSVDDEIQLAPITENFSKLDSVLHNMGAGNIKTLSNVAIHQITESGIYLIDDLINPPDIPSKDNRQYLVEIYRSSGGGFRCPRVLSYGTGKMYYYTGNGYEDIPCTSPYQPENLYIDSVYGSDENDGSEQHPVSTWECAYSRIPKILTKHLFIRFKNINSTTKVVFNNITYQGLDDYSTKLDINGYDHVVDTLVFLNCNISGAHYGINVFNFAPKKIIMEGSSTARFKGCKSENIEIQDSHAVCEECPTQQYSCRRRGFMNVINHITPEVLGRYGCHSEWGGYIYVEGNKPTGTTGDKYEAHGGKVEIIE